MGSHLLPDQNGFLLGIAISVQSGMSSRRIYGVLPPRATLLVYRQGEPVFHFNLVEQASVKINTNHNKARIEKYAKL